MTQEMKKNIAGILNKYKQGELTLDSAQRYLSVIYGDRKTHSCNLDRYFTECSIILNSSFKDCKGCGHFLK